MPKDCDRSGKEKVRSRYSQAINAMPRFWAHGQNPSPSPMLLETGAPKQHRNNPHLHPRNFPEWRRRPRSTSEVQDLGSAIEVIGGIRNVGNVIIFSEYHSTRGKRRYRIITSRSLPFSIAIAEFPWGDAPLCVIHSVSNFLDTLVVRCDVLLVRAFFNCGKRHGHGVIASRLQQTNDRYLLTRDPEFLGRRNKCWVPSKLSTCSSHEALSEER